MADPTNRLGRRDMLAIDRTKLANQRTLLSYGRTAIGLVALAAFLFHFADSNASLIFGFLSLAAGAGIAYLGFRSYREVAKQIKHEYGSNLSDAENLEVAVDDD